MNNYQVNYSSLFNRYNMQKVTYVLLQRHANSYWQTERDDDIRSGTICSNHGLGLLLK